MSDWTVREFMTRDPKTIRRDQTVGEARELMRDCKIRHLIVTSRGELEGIVTERDLDAIQRGCRLDESSLAVEEAMMPVIYRVPASARVGAVALEMAEKKYGSAVVIDEQGKCIGLFTTIDALRALARLTS
jgi:CBS domain-containing protein